VRRELQLVRQRRLIRMAGIDDVLVTAHDEVELADREAVGTFG